MLVYFVFVEIKSASTRRYQSRINSAELARNARMELFPSILKKNGKARRDAISKHQQFKIFLLALSCGFRRAEIDRSGTRSILDRSRIS